MSLEGYSLFGVYPPDDVPEWSPAADDLSTQGDLDAADFAFVAVVNRKYYGKREFQQAYFYAKIRPNTRVKAFRKHFARPNMVGIHETVRIFNRGVELQDEFLVSDYLTSSDNALTVFVDEFLLAHGLIM